MFPLKTWIYVQFIDAKSQKVAIIPLQLSGETFSNLSHLVLAWTLSSTLPGLRWQSICPPTTDSYHILSCLHSLTNYPVCPLLLTLMETSPLCPRETSPACPDPEPALLCWDPSPEHLEAGALACTCLEIWFLGWYLPSLPDTNSWGHLHCTPNPTTGQQEPKHDSDDRLIMSAGRTQRPESTDCLSPTIRQGLLSLSV